MEKTSLLKVVDITSGCCATYPTCVHNSFEVFRENLLAVEKKISELRTYWIHQCAASDWPTNSLISDLFTQNKLLLALSKVLCDRLSEKK